MSEIQGLQDFQNNVESAKDHYAEQFVIKFYQDGHGPSKEMQKGYLKMAKAFDGAANFFAVGCNRHKKVCEKAGLGGGSKLPTVKFYGAGDNVIDFDGKDLSN